MNDFNFEIILNHSMETFPIKPPLSFTSLMEIASQRFDLAKITGFFCTEDESEVSNDTNYFKFLNWADSSNLNEIELIIKCSDIKSKKKKPNRKASQSYKPPGGNIEKNYVPNEGTINGRKFF